jgi:transcriptional regulator with XRE-family HTH domain
MDNFNTYKLPANNSKRMLASEEASVFGSRVSKLRKLQNLSISKFAQMANLSRPTIYKIENGQGNPRLNDMVAIADALGVPLVDLLTIPEK